MSEYLDKTGLAYLWSKLSEKITNLSNARIRKTQTLEANQYGTAQIPTITGYIPYSIVPTGYESHGVFFYRGAYVTRFVNTPTAEYVFKPVSNVSVKCEVFYEKI